MNIGRKMGMMIGAGGEVGMEGDEERNGVMMRMGWISGWDGSCRWRPGWR